MSYFAMHNSTPVDGGGGYYDVQDGIDLDGVRSWAIGEPVGVRIPHPLVIPIRAVEGFRGEPGDLLDGYMCLMSARLVEALLAAGVDSLEVFDACLVDESNGRTFPYRAVNILGLVETGDCEPSNWRHLCGPVLLSTLVLDRAIDPTCVSGRRMFRLAAATGVIVVHAAVKEHLETIGGLTLRFVPVE